ncbi:MAG: three-Cys-motif partner protein TcmP [Pirellulaceae bacterium]
MVDQFFDESREQSQVKTSIVQKYLMAWFNVIKRHAQRSGNKVAYLDLFAGPGRYQDGTLSTPLLILQKAIEHPELREMLITVFNDKDQKNSQALEIAIQSLPNLDRLRYQPEVRNKEVGIEMINEVERLTAVPTIFFVDPWGYKGLSLQLINSVLKGWACECIFFFNYARINAGLSNPLVKQHMDALFGERRADLLRPRLAEYSATERELAIVEELSLALQEMGGKYVLPFRFKRLDGSRTSHHLIFVSKHPKGYEIMKDVMARESSGDEDGVPTFEYNESFRSSGILFEFARPISHLKEMLLDEYAGRTMAMNAIYESHHLGRRFVKNNYKTALLELEQAGSITCNPPVGKRRKKKGLPTFGDQVIAQFPLQPKG